MSPARGAGPSAARRGEERLRRSDRLRKAREFRGVSRRGRRAASPRFPGFVVVAAEAAASGDGPRTRLGLAVGRKVGGAVVRNAVKRRVREWFRRGGRERLPAGADVVVIARAPAAGLDAAGVRRQLDGLCRALAGDRA